MLELKNVKKFYNNSQLKAVDIKKLSVKKGEIVCIIGPSGCGKTTTLKLINHLIPIDEGSIEINGEKSSDSDPIQWRRKIGYVVQKIGLLPHLTILENISLLPFVLKRDKNKTQKRAYELMELFGLNPKEYKNRYPLELSGGQKQRVGLARALMEDPPLLLMDEPFGALDPITNHIMRTEFLKLNQNLKKTIILVTHNIQEAFEMADYLVLMNKGSILQKGTKEELQKQPLNLFVTKFLSEQES